MKNDRMMQVNNGIFGADAGRLFPRITWDAPIQSCCKQYRGFFGSCNNMTKSLRSMTIVNSGFPFFP
jgi:hypothetical protein